MAGVDLSLDLREAVVERLLADSLVNSLSGGRIFGEQVEANVKWPFVRYGLPIAGPYESSCLIGSEFQVTIHTFERGPGTDKIYRLNRAIVEALSGDELPLNTAQLVSLDWTGTDVLNEQNEANDYHGLIRFNAVVGIEG